MTEQQSPRAGDGNLPDLPEPAGIGYYREVVSAAGTKYVYRQAPSFTAEQMHAYALAAAPAVSAPAWQPIETAPTGRRALLWAPGWTAPVVDDWGKYSAYNHPKFTHWMPLPALPVFVPDPTAPIMTLPAAQLGGSSISFSGLKAISFGSGSGVGLSRV
jgi:hypothetical protein